MTCTGCGASNPEEARFCAECGHALDQPAGESESPDDPLRRYIPPELMQKLESARDRSPAGPARADSRDRRRR